MSIRRLLLIAGLTLLAAPVLAVTPEQRTVTVQWQANLADHAWVDRGALGLYGNYLLNADVVWLGQPSAVRCGTVDFWTAPPGYIGTFQRLEYFLDVTRPGKYYVWYLLRAPQPMTVKHLEGVDSSFGAPIGWVSLDIKQANTWTWLRREGQVEFTAGLHELQMADWTPPWTRGLDLSLVVLTSDKNWTPPAVGALSSPAPPVSWTEATAYTADIQPSTVLKWDRLATLGSTGRVALAYSTDAGRTWSPVPAGGDLSGVLVKTDGTDRLRFRATLTHAGEERGAMPEVEPLLLTYTGDRDDLFSLSDATARYFFAKKTGALCGIQNAVTGTWLTPERQPQPIFSVRLRPVAGAPEKDWETVTSLDATCLSATPLPPREGGRGVGSATFTYRITRPDGTATVTLTATLTGPGELTWIATVKNNLRNFDVVDLTYPIAYGVKASANPADDIMLINGNYLVHAPCNFGRFLYYWPTSGIPLMDVFSPKEGLTVVAHDDTLRSTGISARGLDRQSVELSLIKIVNIRPGQSFTGAPSLLRVHQGDWHSTALTERAWLAVHRPTAVPPLWLAQCDGWTPTGWPAGWWCNMGILADSINPPLLPGEGGRGVRQPGLPWIQYWNFQVPGTVWTIPHPNPINGDEEDLRWGIDQIHRRGIRTTFYIQGLLYDPQGDGSNPNDPIGYLHRRDLWPGWELPPAGFTEANRRRDADGEGHEWSAREVEMCYADRAFQEYKRHWAIDLFMKRLGLDGIYWDSLSYGGTCWGTGHGHDDDPGQWGRGAQANHAQILREARRLNPGAVMANEGPPSDTLGEINDVQLDNAPNLDVVRMFFPKMLIYLGNSDGADPSHQKSFLYGCRFDGIGSDPAQQALLRIRRLTKQYLYPATPMDTMGLKIENGDSVQARWFLCDPTRTKGAVVNLLNDQKVAGATITVPTIAVGPIQTAWLADSTGFDGPLTGGGPVEGGKAYRFPVPAAAAATVLLLGPDAEPRVTVENETLVSRGGEAKVTVQIESLTGEQVRGTVAAQAPPGFSAVPAPFDCAGAQAQTIILTLPVALTAPLGLTDVPLEIKVNGGGAFHKLATFYVEPPVRVTPVWARPELLRVTVENRSLTPQPGRVTLRPVKGAVRFSLPPPVAGGGQGGGLSWPFTLAPGARTTISVPLSGAYACQTPWAVRGELTVGGQTYPLYTPFRAAILNGSLELHHWRQDVPDWWWGTYEDRSPKIWGSGDYSVDDTVAADGKYSLKIVGKADQWSAAWLDLTLTPGQTYRFHVKIRRTANAPGIFAGINESGRLPDGKPESITHALGRQTTGPLDQWQEFETTFTALPPGEQAGARLYLYADHTAATAWFDDIRLVPDELPGASGGGG